MSETFGLEIYASNKLAYAGRAQKLIIPAVDGEQGFLAHHANVVVHCPFGHSSVIGIIAGSPYTVAEEEKIIFLTLCFLITSTRVRVPDFRFLCRKSIFQRKNTLPSFPYEG